MIKVLVKKLKPSVKLPSYKTNGASGMDLMAYIDKSIGFESDFNEVSIFYKNKKIERLKYKSKSEISDELVEKIIDHLN